MRGLKRVEIFKKKYGDKSHLLQMRGLKQLTKAQAEYTEKVASFTDAWIETREGLLKISSFRSHLLQMRGLKLTFTYP